MQKKMTTIYDVPLDKIIELYNLLLTLIMTYRFGHSSCTSLPFKLHVVPFKLQLWLHLGEKIQGFHYPFFSPCICLTQSLAFNDFIEENEDLDSLMTNTSIMTKILRSKPIVAHLNFFRESCNI